MDIRLVYNCADMPTKIIIAPQSFKGGLFAMAAAQAIERGVLAATAPWKLWSILPAERYSEVS